MRHQYKVLDTNLYIANPFAIYDFKPKKEDVINHVVIPMQVLKELDRLGGEKTERGKCARKTLSILRQIRSNSEQSLYNGVKLEDNYIIQSSMTFEDKIKNDVRKRIGNSHDSSMIQVAQNIKDQGYEVELVTNDSGAFILADVLGIEVNSWGALEIKDKNYYKGWRECEEIDYGLFNKKRFPAEEVGLTNLLPNEYVIFKNNPNEPLIHKDGMLEPLYLFKNRKSKVKAKNPQQKCLMHALRDPEINIVFAIGRAGTAKTFLSVDAGLEMCFYEYFDDYKKENMGRIEDEIYGYFDKFLITRPVVPEKDNYFDLGALPGELEDKLGPWIRPIYDQLDTLSSYYNYSEDEIIALKEQKKMEILATLHMRGRSLNDYFWLIDEAQNSTTFQLKTALTRIGENSKVVITGDPEQCDIKGMDGLNSNTIIYANEQFKDYKGSATVMFDDQKHCVRSELAAESTKRL